LSGCCRPGDFDGVFTAASSADDARQYRRRGLTGEAKRIVGIAREHGIGGRSVLEVGGGVGAIQIELLRAGAAETTNVELSTVYEQDADRLFDEAGLSGRTTRRVADFVDEAEQVPLADVVILQRVVCCYPDAAALVGKAAAHARELLVLTFPVDRFWAPLAAAAINIGPRVRRSRFRFFVHRTRSVTVAAEGAGMSLVERDVGVFWQLLVFDRASAQPR